MLELFRVFYITLLPSSRIIDYVGEQRQLTNRYSIDTPVFVPLERHRALADRIPDIRYAIDNTIEVPRYSIDNGPVDYSIGSEQKVDNTLYDPEGSIDRLPYGQKIDNDYAIDNEPETDEELIDEINNVLEHEGENSQIDLANNGEDFEIPAETLQHLRDYSEHIDDPATYSNIDNGQPTEETVARIEDVQPRKEMALTDRLLIRKIMQQIMCQDNENCDQQPLYKALMGYGFLAVFFLALFGNCINLLIYNSEQIRYYLAIRMLCTKLLMNSMTMLFLVPQALRTIESWIPGSEADRIYWQFWPYQTYFVNVFGFCAMWLTVLMTGECYLHVFFPGRSKSMCTRKNLTRSYVIMALAGGALALNYPLNRHVNIVQDSCGNGTRVEIQASDNEIMKMIEKAHTVGHLLFAIVVPLGLLVFMTVSISWKLVFRQPEFPNSSHFSNEKRCVTRITLITTTLQMFAELPSVPVFVYAAAAGPHVINESTVCVWNTVGLFLGLCNMSLSFFVYIAFSQRFRGMMLQRLGSFWCCSLVRPPLSKSVILQQPINIERSTQRTVISPKSSESEKSMLIVDDCPQNGDAFL